MKIINKQKNKTENDKNKHNKFKQTIITKKIKPNKANSNKNKQNPSFSRWLNEQIKNENNKQTKE